MLLFDRWVVWVNVVKIVLAVNAPFERLPSSGRPATKEVNESAKRNLVHRLRAFRVTKTICWWSRSRSHPTILCPDLAIQQSEKSKVRGVLRGPRVSVECPIRTGESSSVPPLGERALKPRDERHPRILKDAARQLGRRHLATAPKPARFSPRQRFTPTRRSRVPFRPSRGTRSPTLAIIMSASHGPPVSQAMARPTRNHLLECGL